MQYGDIGGPYVPLYPEVVLDLLNDIEGYAARWLYVAIITLFQVEEDWGGDADWIAGVINTTKAEIMRKSEVGGKGKGGFWKAWEQLVGAGLVVEQKDKSFRLPHFKKKRYDAISPREIREKIAHLENEMEKLREELHETEGSSRPDLSEKRQKESSERTKESSERTDQSSERTTDIYIDPEKKKTLSLIDIVDLFYKGIGQEKISRGKRESGVQISRKLIQDGFDPADIQFAMEWTLENATKEIYDFSIVEHTIGQAMAARRRKDAQMREIQEREQERERNREEEQASQEREEREQKEIEICKEGMDSEARTRLREEAQAEIRNSEFYKEDFVSDTLINVMENTILRQRLLQGAKQQEQDG